MTIATNDLGRAKNGSLAAYRRLVERFRSAAVAVGLANLLPVAKARTIAEEALLDAHALLSECETETDLGRIIVTRGCAIARSISPGVPGQPHALMRLIKKKSVERRPGTGLVVRGDLGKVVTALLLATPESARVSLALRTYAGLSYDEIAALQSISSSEVAGQLAHAMRELRAAFDR